MGGILLDKIDRRAKVVAETCMYGKDWGFWWVWGFGGGEGGGDFYWGFIENYRAFLLVIVDPRGLDGF